MEIAFTGTVIEWRGPAPYYYVPLSDGAADDIRELSSMLTYGWGVIPVTVRLGGSGWTTSLFPKDGGYLLPLRAAERRREGIELGDEVAVVLEV
jgi:hypothetical protein